MAGDWIKMRTALAEDPAVISIASKLDMEEFAVVGRLHQLWSWADHQSRDGHASGVTQKWVDRYLERDGFAAALVEVGWLIIDDTGITLPNFDRHNGETAKTRALGSKRKQKERGNVTQEQGQMSRNERDKSVTREEKRREEVVVTAKADATVVELRPEQQQPAGLCLDNPTAFAKSVAEAYAKAYRVDVPPVPLMTAMSIVQRIDFYPATAELSWWEVYFQLCFEDLYLTNRESLDQPLGRKAARFDTLISEKTISAMVDRNNREAAHA